MQSRYIGFKSGIPAFLNIYCALINRLIDFVGEKFCGEYLLLIKKLLTEMICTIKSSDDKDLDN